MKLFKELMEECHENKVLCEATGAQIKKWFASKGVKVKAAKIGSKHIRAYGLGTDGKLMGIIPNKIRASIMKLVMPDARIINPNDIHYGNVTDTSIALTVEQWDLVMGEL
jgi:hypothetical protein